MSQRNPSTKHARKAAADSSRRALSPSRRKSTRKSPRKQRRDMPPLFRYLLAGAMTVCFALFFYYFFVRPYSYRWKSCPGNKEYGVCIPCGYQVHGIDISHHQGRIDWDRLAASRREKAPLHFVFMKATEGGDHCDDMFGENLDQARQHGFLCGAYHFFNPATDALRQADFFISQARLCRGDLPPVLDVETTGGKDKKELQHGVKQWLDRVEQHYGVKPILYTSYKFKSRYLNDSLFDAYPYWIAHYYVDTIAYQGAWSFWQHTDVGDVPGIPKRVDLNVFNGSIEELKALTLQ